VEFWNEFVKLVNGHHEILVIGIMVLIDLIVGVTVALKNKDFHFAFLADFLETTVVKYVLGYVLVCGAAAVAGDNWQSVALASYVIILAAMTAELYVKFQALGLNWLPSIPGISAPKETPKP
jgi:hypothetical protein